METGFLRRFGFAVLAVASGFVALVGFVGPNRAPVNIHFILVVGIPLACLWTCSFLLGLWFYRWRALWMLIAAPLVLYWPLWLFVNGIPLCYRLADCV